MSQKRSLKSSRHWCSLIEQIILIFNFLPFPFLIIFSDDARFALSPYEEAAFNNIQLKPFWCDLHIRIII